jgi:four helix bundle protein
MLNDLVIYQKCYDLVLYAYPIIAKYPRNARFTLGQQTTDLLIETMRLIARANKERDKKRTLWEIDSHLEELRLLTRLAKDLKMLSVHQYGLLNERISEIGRLLGGWMKSCAG